MNFEGLVKKPLHFFLRQSTKKLMLLWILIWCLDCGTAYVCFRLHPTFFLAYESNEYAIAAFTSNSPFPILFLFSFWGSLLFLLVYAGHYKPKDQSDKRILETVGIQSFWLYFNCFFGNFLGMLSNIVAILVVYPIYFFGYIIHFCIPIILIGVFLFYFGIWIIDVYDDWKDNKERKDQ